MQFQKYMSIAMFNAFTTLCLTLLTLIEQIFVFELTDSRGNCNATYTDTDVIIGYATNHSVYCVNSIKAPKDHRIVVTILELNILHESNGHTNCKNYLSFSPVDDSESRRVLKLCGLIGNDTRYKQIVSLNNTLNFQFLIESHLRYSFLIIFKK